MICVTIRNVPVLFIKAFGAQDVEQILQFVRDAYDQHAGDGRRVLFIDTPITQPMVEAVERLHDEGFAPVVRDHHGIDGAPRNERERQVVNGTDKLRALLNKDCNITVRRLHPACSTLVECGEFGDAVAIIADPDADGLTAAMKAVGITYPGLDEDAAILDGEPQAQTSGSEISRLLAKGVAVIPSYDASKPKEREVAYQQLFGDWVAAVEGDRKARRRLEAQQQKYDDAVVVAAEIAKHAREVAPYTVLADTAERELYDPGTLTALLERHASGPRVTVIRKSLGPIAAVHGIQYSLAVAREFHDSVDLRELVPKSAKSDPEGGIISNVSFLLHVSEEVWSTHVLPKLRAGVGFGG